LSQNWNNAENSAEKILKETKRYLVKVTKGRSRRGDRREGHQVRERRQQAEGGRDIMERRRRGGREQEKKGMNEGTTREGRRGR
jgi:hypothetical protein